MALKEDNPQRIGIEPFSYSDLQPGSVDVHLDDEIIYDGHRQVIVLGGTILLRPHGVCLAALHEHITTPTDCISRVEGKSSIGRQFVVVHCTAGWGDAGFTGNFTLEIVNHHPEHFFALTYRMAIAQITFLQMDRPALKPYRGRYQYDTKAQEAKP